MVVAMAGREAGLVSSRFRWIYWIFVVTVFVIGIDEVLSLRGVRIGGGYRSSSVRVRTSPNVRYPSSSTRVRVRYNTYRPWRSWHSYGSSGHIYGYVYYTRRHSHYSSRDREPTICYNEHDNFMDNGTNYEWFICPNISNPDNYDSCCGDEDRQYCCKSSLDGARVFGIIVGIFIFGLTLILLIYCCCCRKTNGRESAFQQRFMSKRVPPQPNVQYRPNANGVTGNTAEMTHLVNPPVNGPNPSFPQNDQPVYPPMPLGPQPTYPPQPAPGYQSGPYPPVDPGMYPPYPPCAGIQPGPPTSTDLPYSVQPPMIDPSMGYPPNPSSTSAPPYPTEGASAPPYPSDGYPAPPYPIAGNAAPPYPPYPTAAPAYPYPTDGSSANYPASPPPSYSSMK